MTNDEQFNLKYSKNSYSLASVVIQLYSWNIILVKCLFECSEEVIQRKTAFLNETKSKKFDISTLCVHYTVDFVCCDLYIYPLMVETWGKNNKTMTMKKTIQAFLLLSLVHIFLCASFQVGVTEATFRHLGQCLFIPKIFITVIV